MAERLDFAELRRIAERADHGGRPWDWGGKYPQMIERVGDVVLVAECFTDPDHTADFANFIATFDPPTVLALLDLLAGRSGEADG